MSTRQIYYVLAKDLQYGNGIMVDSMDAMKKSLLKKTPKGMWNLVISIHGSLGVLATRGGYLKRKDTKGVYREADIDKIFNDDKKFVAWRKKYGPNRVILVGCQVELKFEKHIIKTFVKPTSKQKAIGLGARCRPHTIVTTLFWEQDGKDIDIDSRTDWRKLSGSARRILTDQLKEWNRKYGYFGAPPVPDADLLDFYFDEAPKGRWVFVTVSLDYKDQPNITFWNRGQSAEFLMRVCPAHAGDKLRKRNSKAPPMP